MNDKRKIAMARKIETACGGSVAGKRIAVLGLTYKPKTDDMRDAPSLVIVPELQTAGASIVAYDPEGIKMAQPLLPGVEFVDNAYACLGACLLNPGAMGFEPPSRWESGMQQIRASGLM